MKQPAEASMFQVSDFWLQVTFLFFFNAKMPAALHSEWLTRNKYTKTPDSFFLCSEGQTERHIRRERDRKRQRERSVP